MLYEKTKKYFHNTSDLLYKKINNINIIYFESLCSSNKINEYILKNISLIKNYNNLKDIISDPSIKEITKFKDITNYLSNGYTIIYDDITILACETKADLYRSISIPTSEASINGPKDSFNESITTNLGLIKRRIKTNNLITKDFFIGTNTETKVSVLYLKDKSNKNNINTLLTKLSTIKEDILDIEILIKLLNTTNNPLPTILKTERPDETTNALLEGKIVIIADNSPYALITPSYLIDFINPIGDNYVKNININFLKIIRFLCLIITLLAPALYISMINYNSEIIPLELLLSFQENRLNVPFPSGFEAIFMIILCAILRESDIRFPSSYGSSISILGALILGEAAVNAGIASPIMIIVIGITFITGLIFNNGEIISGLRYYRFILLISSILFGLYGLTIGIFFILVNLTNQKVLDEHYLFPFSPYNESYLFKTFIKKDKESK